MTLKQFVSILQCFPILLYKCYYSIQILTASVGGIYPRKKGAYLLKELLMNILSKYICNSSKQEITEMFTNNRLTKYIYTKHLHEILLP